MNHLSIIARAAGSTDSSGDATSLSEDARAFLQRRVAALGLVLGCIFGSFFVFRVVLSILDDTTYGEAFNVWGAVPFLGVTTAASLALWLYCRRQPRSLRAIRRAEAICLEIACTSMAMLPFHVPYSVRPDYIVLMAIGLTVVSRAVYVPGTARQTVLTGAVVGVPLLVLLYFVHLRGHDPAHYTPAALGFVQDDPTMWAMRWVMIDTLWWITFVAVAAAASKVIYGLRAEVRDARKLGQYTLDEKIGEGGMGTVYRARHAMLRRPAAVKLLPPDRIGEQSLARFEREVQLTASLSHPSTVRVFDYGRTPDGVFYYAMEYLDGANLAEVVTASGAMPPARVIHVLTHLAGALGEAHTIGLIHRDIKPANVLLTEQGGVADVVKVVDFGLVKDVTERGAVDITAPAITQANTLAGTPHYMAPEAISSPERVDARTDLYALGAVGYYLLTGHDVFPGRNAFEVFGHHLHTTPEPPSARLGRAVPEELERLILSCLEKEPSHRPQSARSLEAALRRMRDDHAWTEDDAQRWWSRHGDHLRARRTRGPLATGTTMAVDLDERAVG